MLPFTEKEKIATDIRFNERFIKKKKNSDNLSELSDLS